MSEDDDEDMAASEQDTEQAAAAGTGDRDSALLQPGGNAAGAWATAISGGAEGSPTSSASGRGRYEGWRWVTSGGGIDMYMYHLLFLELLFADRAVTRARLAS